MFARTRRPTIIDAVRWCVAAILLLAGAGHVQNPHLVLHDVLNYELMIGIAAVWIAILLPFCEFALAALLLSNCSHRPVFALAALMFGIFAAAQWSAWSRGLVIDCGCLGGLSRRPIGAWSLLFLSSLFAVSAAGAVAGRWLPPHHPNTVNGD